jgi:heme/copper-type cytochrome/quinol oxidase subunit 2
VENTAWFLAKTLSRFTTDGSNWVKCNELCGIRHAYMKTGLYVVSQSAFVNWAKRQEQYEKSIGVLKNLPKYASVYYPAANSNWPAAPQDQSP